MQERGGEKGGHARQVGEQPGNKIELWTEKGCAGYCHPTALGGGTWGVRHPESATSKQYVSCGGSIVVDRGRRRAQ